MVNSAKDLATSSSEKAEKEDSSILESAPRPQKRKNVRKPERENYQHLRYYKQNPSRNIITNIGNQLLTYISTPGKSEATLRQIRPQYERQDLDAFYLFTKKLKKDSDYYLNLHKMQALWYPVELELEFQDFQRAVRTLSSCFLSELLPPCIITSTKMKRETKYHHMKVRMQLINLLRRRTASLPKSLTNIIQLYRKY